ncbi:endonuclease/exonuclease/phosphatase family protein [Microbispora sp. RL4-1S]|uniref:Endonuclease/exonuclease/phosphatase family protein n=1 Tax=Microbispora oryzae TaxID=2806554 RepID=A0A941AM64_9ACTN|nr:endonuclease/exonuclease/phosphatase family protein [Microbispora oryzae]MBP2707008.1 endonuclease/exonuclease/phosphatase family protein [Microbispora oryzae]
MPPLSTAATAGSSVTLTSPSQPQKGDRLTFRWTTDAPDAKNWIGVYDGDRKPASGSGSLVWSYTAGESGEVTLNTSTLIGGPYTAYLLAKDGYGILAQSEPFSFAGSPSGDSIVLASPAHPLEGDRLTFHWTTEAPDAKNWIGVYDGNRQPGNGGSLVWVYTPGASGDTTLDTGGLTGGPYTAYLLAKDGYGVLAKTTPFGFAPRPVTPRPYAAVDAFTTAPQTVGTALSVRLGGLWVRPEGNPDGRAEFTRAEGDAWLSVTADGTVTGTVPARAPKTPGRLLVGVRDSAAGTDTVTVQVPVRQTGDRVPLKIATLNLWDAGTHVAGALEKQIRLVLTQNLDVVALQETGDTGARALADALGWNVHQTTGGLGIVSRHPLGDVVVATAGLPAAAATVRLPGDRTVRLWTAQLDEAGYGPYALLAGRTAADVEAAEKLTLRYRQVQALLTAMRGDLSSGVPVVLAAGLASPSHLDWTSRTASAHGGVRRLRWPVTYELERAKLVDAFREANPNPAKAPGYTWSPVRPERDGGGPEPQDRVDQIQYAGALKVVEAHTLYTGWPRPVPGTAGNGWPSDHAAAVVTFTLSASRG